MYKGQGASVCDSPPFLNLALFFIKKIANPSDHPKKLGPPQTDAALLPLRNDNSLSRTLVTHLSFFHMMMVHCEACHDGTSRDATCDVVPHVLLGCLHETSGALYLWKMLSFLF